MSNESEVLTCQHCHGTTFQIVREKNTGGVHYVCSKSSAGSKDGCSQAVPVYQLIHPSYDAAVSWSLLPEQKVGSNG